MSKSAHQEESSGNRDPARMNAGPAHGGGGRCPLLSSQSDFCPFQWPLIMYEKVYVVFQQYTVLNAVQPYHDFVKEIILNYNSNGCFKVMSN